MQPRPLALTLLVSAALLATLVAWALAPPPPRQDAEPTVPPELVQRIEKLEAFAAKPPPPPPPEAEPEPPPAPPTIWREPLDGQDLADLFGLSIWKFNFRLPPGGKDYTAYLWLERWTKGSDTPEYELLQSESGPWTESGLLVKLPSDDHPSLYTRIDPIGNTFPPREASVLPPLPINWTVLESLPLKLNEPIQLVTMTHDLAAKPPDAAPDAPHDHDVAVYIKAGLIEGSYVPFDPAKWVARPGSAPKKEASNFQ